MRRLLLVALTVGAAGAVAAAPADCVKVDSDLDRLACYDKESGRTSTPLQSPAAGKWRMETRTNALTDKTDVFLGVESEEVVNCGWNRGAKIMLQMRCMENTTSLVIATGCHMTSSQYNDYGDVTYRLDEEPARTVGMVESTNNRSLGLWNGGRSIPVIKQMLGKARMIVKMTPFSENPFTATFNISGLDASIEPLRQACGWK